MPFLDAMFIPGTASNYCRGKQNSISLGYASLLEKNVVGFSTIEVPTARRGYSLKPHPACSAVPCAVAACVGRYRERGNALQ